MRRNVYMKVFFRKHKIFTFILFAVALSYVVVLLYDYNVTKPVFLVFDDRPFVPATCPQEGQVIVDKYEGMKENEIVGCQSKKFVIDNKDVYFIHIEYGIGHDCLSGCLFSHYCAVVEDGIDYPYSFGFYEEEEVVIKIPREANAYLPYCTDSRTCREELTGLNHKLVQTREFSEFREAEIVRGGQSSPFSEWRGCQY